MRIVIDMQGAQTASRFRGIGRYTMSFVQALLRNCGEHEIILALSDQFPETIDSIRKAFDGLLSQKNILVWSTPASLTNYETCNFRNQELVELIREAFLASLQPDVIHISSLFEGFLDNAVTSIGKFDTQTPVTSMLFDLIPLINAEKYLLPDSRYSSFYMQKIQYLQKARILLTISDYSREEGLENLDLNAKQVVNISAAVDPSFIVLRNDILSKNILPIQLRSTSHFILYSGGSDERKNLPRLIKAYAKLPKQLRKAYQLVFAGKMPDEDIKHLKLNALKFGIKDDELVFTGYVSDEQLISLYNLCSVYVMPSWHEGFGLPVLEAMACGAAVIGSKTSSLSEIIGLQEALFDPFDVDDISAKLHAALSNVTFNKKLREHGAYQYKKFDWDKVAQRALSAWLSCCDNNIIRTASWRETQDKLSLNYKKIVSRLAAILNEADEQTVCIVAKCLEKNEHQINTYHRANKLPEVITWRIEGPFDSSYSLALVNREIAKAISILGHRVVLHSTEGPGDFDADKEFLSANPSLDKMHQLSSVISGWEANITSRNLYPPRVTDMVSPLNFLHAYGWEESGFPLDWIDNFNYSLQGMTVMSEHVRKILLDHGFYKPIAVSSIGVDHWLSIESDSRYKLEANSFRFLHVSSCFPRKGVDVLLKAYGKAFCDKDDVTLVIKTFPNPHNEIHRWLKEAREGDPHYPDVQIIEEDLSEGEIKALYEQCQVLVAPSRAEGFGLPMAEAMLSDLAVITTGWGGQTDFCTNDTAWLIDYKFERAQSHFGIFSSVWAEPDQIQLSQLMIDVRNTPINEREKRINRGKALLLKKFRWQHASIRIIEAARYCSAPLISSEPKIGWVSTWNTKCGIAEYSKNLINKMDQSVIVLAPYSKEVIDDDLSNVCRSWAMGENDDLMHLDQEIDRLGINTLIIQFNYGFFNLENFSKFVLRQSNLGRVIVVIFHSTTDPVDISNKKLLTTYPALRSCSRLLVHSPDDMNRLKKLGLVDNVALFPHGVVDYSPIQKNNIKILKSQFVIASYGFFLPHKGLMELVNAVYILKARGINVRLNMVNAEYPIEESKKLIDKVKQKITDLGLEMSIFMYTDYLEENKSIDMLANADLIIYPYQYTNESSSAAVRAGIASKKPVAVTPLDIFSDVSEIVYKLPGVSAEKIADGILNWLDESQKEDGEVSKISERAERWRTQHTFDVVSRRLAGLIKGLLLSRMNN